MRHVYWVYQRLLGGRPGPTRFPWDPAELYAGGIRAVITLASEEDVDDLSGYGIEHIRAEFPPVLLFSPGMRRAFIYQALPVWATIHRLLQAQRPTLVHCYAGKDRTGAILAGYLVVYLGMTPAEAVAVLRSVNPEAMTAAGYGDVIDLLQPGRIPDRAGLL